MSSQVSEKEALLIFCDAVESAIIQLRQNLGEKTKTQTHPWDPNKVKWVEEEGFKGKYERYPPQDGKAEATLDYKNMLEDLKEHKNTVWRDGYFYWLFSDMATVGRKKKEKKT